jgi:F-type H+-transporting ATPase subunit gamma
MVLGEHARREIRRRGLEVAWEGALPVTSVPSFGMAAELAATGLRRYEAGELAAFYVTYNHYLGAGRYAPKTATLIPFPPMDHSEEEPGWPPPVIQTDVRSLCSQAEAQLAALSLYELLLESTAAEQSARFQLMDGASQNSRRLIEELTLTYHTARQEAVTEEMLELAVSAGLVSGG